MSKPQPWYTFDKPDGSAELRRDGPPSEGGREYGVEFHGDESIVIATAIADRHNETIRRSR